MESQPPCYFLNQINNRFFRKAFLPITERFFESLTPRFLLHLKSCGCLLQSVSSTVLHYLGSLFGTVRVFLAGVNPCVPQSFLQRSYATLLPHFLSDPMCTSSSLFFNGGFHQRSYKMTVSAPVRFNPVPQPLRKSEKHLFRQH